MSTHPNTKSNLTNPSLPNHKRVTSASSVFIPKPKHKRPLTSLSDLNKINIFRNKKDSKLDVLNLIIETNPSKYNLNKLGKTLGSVAFDATVDGRITLIENKESKKYVNLQTINRDFPEFDIQLKKTDNLNFKKINSIEEDELSYELTSFIKYVASQKEIDFTCTDIVLKANIPMSPKRFGRLLNNCIELLESEGVHITKCRTADNRFYHATFEEPSLNETE